MYCELRRGQPERFMLGNLERHGCVMGLFEVDDSVV